MAEQKQKFEPKDNIPYVVKFTHRTVKQFDPPAEHPDWGHSYLYFLQMEDPSVDDRYKAGEELSWFAKEYPHELITNGGVVNGTRARVMIKQDDADKRKKRWEITVLSGGKPTQQPSQQSQQPPRQQAAQEQAPPAPPQSDVPPPGDEHAQGATAGDAGGESFNAAQHNSIKAEIATTMDVAYRVAKSVMSLHADPLQGFSAEAESACAHTVFIELRKKGWRPSPAEVAGTMKRIREQAGRVAPQN